MARLLLLGLALLGSATTTPLFFDPAPVGSDVTSGPSPSKVCDGKGDGVLVADPTDHAQFYECNHGLAFHFHCPPTLIFSEAAKGCINDPNNQTPKVPCTGTSKFSCTGKTDGFYPDEHDKTKFHECDHGCPTDFNCPPYTYFEPTKNVCAFDSNAGHITTSGSPGTTQTHGPHTEGHHTEPTHDHTTTQEHQTTPTHWTPAVDHFTTQTPHHHEETTAPPHHEGTTATPHFVTPGPGDQTTRGRHN